MKKVLLIGIALLGVSLVSHGQDTNAYQSFFGRESTVWNGVTESYDTDLENHVLQVAYDTVLTVKNTKKCNIPIMDIEPQDTTSSSARIP